MNRLKVSMSGFLLFSFVFSIECGDKASRYETKKTKEEMQQLLFNGVRVSNLKAVKNALMDPRVDINARNIDGETVLTLLALRFIPESIFSIGTPEYEDEYNKIKKLTFSLLQNGANLNASSNYNSLNARALELALGSNLPTNKIGTMSNESLLQMGLGLKTSQNFNKAFIEGVNDWMRFKFDFKLMPHILQNTDLITELGHIIADYAYENSDFELGKEMEEK